MDTEKFETMLVINEEMPPQFFYDLLVKTLGPDISIATPVLETIKISNIPYSEAEKVIETVRNAGGEIIEN